MLAERLYLQISGMERSCSETVPPAKVYSARAGVLPFLPRKMLLLALGMLSWYRDVQPVQGCSGGTVLRAHPTFSGQATHLRTR